MPLVDYSIGGFNINIVEFIILLLGHIDEKRRERAQILQRKSQDIHPSLGLENPKDCDRYFLFYQ